MKFNYEFTPTFTKELKRLLKKYKSLKSDILTLQNELEKDYNFGTDLGGGFRKIRLKITSKNKGKSGGGRIVIHEVFVDIHEKNIVFVMIWDKSEVENISTKILQEILKKYNDKK